jgi:hypothetical protein
MIQHQTREFPRLVRNSNRRKTALLVFASLFLVQLAWAADGPRQLQLGPQSFSELQPHSGQKVILTGYFIHRFEMSTLFPSKQGPKDLDFEDFKGSVWVDFVDGEDSKFWGLPFGGRLRIEGTLETGSVGTDRRYGHLGFYNARLTDARVVGLLPRQWATILVASTAMLLMISFVAWRRRMNARGRGTASTRGGAMGSGEK